MKLTILGATGATGRLVVEQAVSAGHGVTAVVRDPRRMPARDESLDVVVANVFDPESLVGALTDSDAVVSVLGPSGPRDTTMVCSKAMGALVSAMHSAGMDRVVAVSAQPVLRRETGESLWYRGTVRPLVRAIYRNVYIDLERMEEVLQESGTQWSLLRPPHLTDVVATGPFDSDFARLEMIAWHRPAGK